MSVIASFPPEQGQLVTVRQRHYVVADVAQSTLPDRPLRAGGNGAQHLVTLSSVEDDALGEELQVIWELEPGAQIIEKVALPEPTGFDKPERLDAFLDAVTWGAASSAALLREAKGMRGVITCVARSVVTAVSMWRYLP